MITRFKSELLSPRYWPTWLLLGLLWLSLKLPQRLQYRLYRLLGSLLYRLLPGRRHVARTNLKLCFPEMDEREREQRVKTVFHNNAIGILETAMAWWADDESIRARTRVVGLEHLDAALERGKGVILLGAHFTVLDMGSAMMPSRYDFECFYRPHNNALFDYWVTRGRMRYASGLLPAADMRAIVRSLRSGKLVWFAPDQDQGPTHSIYAPFFGVPAATVTSTARLARMTGAAVVPIAFHRNDDDSYELEFRAALDDFPVGDDMSDASRINAELEQSILKRPDQYMWVHRRFKTHPKGKNYLYR